MKQDSQIRAVLFDFGGVIAAEGFAEGLRAIARQQGLDAETLQAQAMDAVYDSGYITGRGSEAAFWDMLRERTGMTGDDTCPSRIFMQPSEDRHGEGRRRPGIQQRGRFPLLVQDDRPVHRYPRTGVFATDGSIRDMTTEVV